MWGWLAKLVAPVVQAVQTVIKAVTAAIGGGSESGGQAGGGAGNSNPGSQGAAPSMDQMQAEDIALMRERQRRAAEQKRQAAINKKISNFENSETVQGSYGPYLHRPADADLWDTPELRTGWRRSLYLSQRNEKTYPHFENAGGYPSDYFALSSSKERMIDREEYLEQRDKGTPSPLEKAITKMAGEDILYPDMSREELARLYVSLVKLREDAIADIQSQVSDVDISKLKNMSIKDLNNLIINNFADLPMPDAATNISDFIAAHPRWMQGVQGMHELISLGITTGQNDLLQKAVMVENVYRKIDGLTEIGQFDNLADVEKFRVLSNIAAAQANNNLSDYLFIMNTMMIEYSTPGDLAVIATKGFTDVIDVNTPSILPFIGRAGIQIGPEGLSHDYDDTEPSQINHHIWSYVATSATPLPWPLTYLSDGLGEFANQFHEIDQQRYVKLLGRLRTDRPNYSWEDFLASDVGLALGEKLRSGEITPEKFGEAFATAFKTDYINLDITSGYLNQYKEIYRVYRDSGETISFAEYLEMLFPLRPQKP